VNDSLSKVRERVRQRHEAHTETLTTTTDSPRPFDDGRGGTFIAGDRVFDTVTGREGIVVATTTENIIVPASERSDR
jgi:hypothetical protein